MKYEVTHSCGHTKVHDIIGKRDKREWRIGRLESEICVDCLAEEHAKENARNAQKNAEAGLPELTGTPKQIAWAETIRQKCHQDFAYFDLFVQHATGYRDMSDVSASERATCDVFAMGMAEYLQKSEAVISKEARLWLKNKETRQELLQKVIEMVWTETDSSSFWINYRTNINKELGRLMGQYVARIVADTPYDDDEEQRTLMREAMIEATIYPSGPTDKLVVEVKVGGDSITLVGQPSQTLYRELVGDIGFAGAGVDTYRLTLQEHHGNIDDLSAELVAKFLEKGYPVRCFDEHIKQKALAGDYEPYNKRWISQTKRDDQYIVIPHFGDDILYHKIRAIRGCKWDDACIVPIECYEDILGFAKINNYRFTKKIQALLDKEIELAEKQVLATKAPKGFKAKEYTEKESSAPAVSTTINPELMDD